jgi:hypothetical protein
MPQDETIKHAEDETIKRLDALMKEGNALAKKFHPNYYKPSLWDMNWLYITPKDKTNLRLWQVEVANVLDRLLPLTRIYLEKFERLTDLNVQAGEIDVYAAVGLLERIKNIVTSDHAPSLSDLVAVQILEDFITMARHLYERKYYEAAVALCGAVLEDGLRRIATNNNLAVDKGDTIGPLNDRCAGKVYDNLTRIKIDGWREIRNTVDHGWFRKWNNDEKKEFIEMIDGVDNFLARYLKK